MWVLLYAKLNQTIMIGDKVRLFSSHRKDKNIEARAGVNIFIIVFLFARVL